MLLGPNGGIIKSPTGGMRKKTAGGGGGGGGRALLTSDDMTYLGIFEPPDDVYLGVRFSYSKGVMTGRRVGSNTHIFLMGSNQNGDAGDDKLYEIQYTGAANTGTIPKATMVREWGQQFWKNASNNSVKLIDSGDGSPTIRGLLYHDDKLWFAYGNHYNTTGSVSDPSIGFAVLNDTTGTAVGYGPWRTQEHSQRTKGYMMEIPADFAAAYTDGKRVTLGAPITSGNFQCPWGPMLAVVDALPTTSTPPDPWASGNNSNYTITFSKYLAKTDTTHRMSRSEFTYCNWNVIYDCAQGSYTLPVTTFSSLDTMTGAAWVQTSTKEGVVMMGHMVGPTATGAHQWYGPRGAETSAGANDGTPCCHGRLDPTQTGTGDSTNLLQATGWIFSRETMRQAAMGEINPWDVTASEEIPLRTKFGTRFLEHNVNYWTGGLWYDSVSRLLFVSHIQYGLNPAGELGNRPVIHVWQIAD